MGGMPPLEGRAAAGGLGGTRTSHRDRGDVWDVPIGQLDGQDCSDSNVDSGSEEGSATARQGEAQPFTAAVLRRLYGRCSSPPSPLPTPSSLSPSSGIGPVHAREGGGSAGGGTGPTMAMRAGVRISSSRCWATWGGAREAQQTRRCSCGQSLAAACPGESASGITNRYRPIRGRWRIHMRRSSPGSKIVPGQVPRPGYQRVTRYLAYRSASRTLRKSLAF